MSERCGGSRLITEWGPIKGEEHRSEPKDDRPCPGCPDCSPPAAPEREAWLCPNCLTPTKDPPNYSCFACGALPERFVAEREAERLREALREIAAGHPDGGPWSGGAEEIARAALSHTPEPEEHPDWSDCKCAHGYICPKHVAMLPEPEEPRAEKCKRCKGHGQIVPALSWDDSDPDREAACRPHTCPRCNGSGAEPRAEGER